MILITKVKDCSFISKELKGEHLVYFVPDGKYNFLCDILPFTNLKLFIKSNGAGYCPKYSMAKDVLNIELEMQDIIEKVISIDNNEVIFHDKNILDKVLFKEETYLSATEFARSNKLSKSTIKRKILEGKINGVIPIHSENMKVSAYVIPENAEIL